MSTNYSADNSNMPGPQWTQANGFLFLVSGTDTYGILPSTLQIGGYQELATLNDRDAIPVSTTATQLLDPDGIGSGRRRIGMTVSIFDPEGDGSIEPKRYVLLPKGYFGNGGQLSISDWNSLTEAEKVVLLDPTATVSGGLGQPDIVGTNDPDDCWVELVHPKELPDGGSAGQVLTKFSNYNGDVAWTDGGTGPQGAQGAVGEAGPQGVTGAEGAQGDTGAQGAVGEAGPQGVTGAEGAQGDTGAQGVAGAAGPQGVTGAEGAQGDTGAQGAVGEAGPQGITGALGPQGPHGPQGAQGFVGPTGPQGAQGATGVGAQGDTGAQGVPGVSVTGPQGAQGAAGSAADQGAQGDTGAQGVAGEAGPQGLTGDQGPKGDTGAQGAIGAAGPQGLTGDQGPKGDTGAQGAIGAAGPQGLTGDQGPKGDTGAQGIAGPAGPQGATGADSTIAGPQGAQGAPGSGGSGGTGVYVIKLEYANSSLIQNPFIAAEAPDGTNLIGLAGWTFTRASDIAVHVNHPVGKNGALFMAHTQLVGGRYVSKAISGQTQTLNSAIQLDTKDYIEFNALNNQIGVSNNTQYVYLTWVFPDNDFFL